ncbi:Bicyclomycin resistance protein [Aquicella siphonis]|uniref:Bcr/CflA family efflux transporter n=1 Tax=Aquicella siphonis TaxID=254247 RepID=A0A5E4PGU9_9COXI|nr:multidrug effflux MFS transporter [Aquicella siphonis]VVC75702.1 Bicyclomycin resistance protein [Aquicella siphonis]
MHPSPTHDNPLTRSVFFIIILFTSLAQITADMYTPSLPYIAKSFNVPNTAIQFTMAVYMLGFSLSHLYYGPLSDRVGRRYPILHGIFLCMLGSLVCAFAPSVKVVLAGRLIQGFGVGACSSVGRPVLRDLLSGGQLARLGSHLGMINVFVVAAAPIAGGYIQHWSGWRANFAALFIYSAVTWILFFKVLPETNKHLDPDATRFREMCKNYWKVITNRTFLGYTFCSCFAYAGLISYLTIAPFLLQSLIGLTPVEYGWLSLFNASSFFISTFINARLIMSKGIARMVSIGNLLMLISGLSMLSCGLLGWLNPFVIVTPIVIFSMGAGFTFSNAFAGAFHPFPKMAGTAGALYGCIQVLGAALMSAGISILPEHNQIPLALVLTLLGLFSLMSLRLLVGIKTEAP